MFHQGIALQTRNSEEFSSFIANQVMVKIVLQWSLQEKVWQLEREFIFARATCFGYSTLICFAKEGYQEDCYASPADSF